MEDDLKISKVEYLSNHWTDLTQIENLSLGDETEAGNIFLLYSDHWLLILVYVRVS